MVYMAGFLFLIGGWIGAVKSGLRQGIARFAKTLASSKTLIFWGPFFTPEVIFGLFLVIFGPFRGS